MHVEDHSIGKLHAKNLHNRARIGRLMVRQKKRKFSGFWAIATATVDIFSKFNLSRVGKRKGYPKK